MRYLQHISVISLLSALILPSAAIADHSWGKYKWKPSSIPFSLNLGDNVNSTWDGHLISTSGDWSVSTVLDTSVVAGSTTPEACEAELDNVQVCNAKYGNTNWLGIAQIYTRGTGIIAGLAKLNDTYFDTSPYNTSAWRRLVMCQEVAHTFGLGHQDEIFNNTNLGSCMDYTDDPDGSIKGQLSNEFPNQHDYDQLETIYLDTKAGSKNEGGNCNPKSPKCNAALSPGNSAHGHSQWGRLVSRPGGVETYEKELGLGYKLITHVIWTLEHADHH